MKDEYFSQRGKNNKKTNLFAVFTAKFTKKNTIKIEFMEGK